MPQLDHLRLQELSDRELLLVLADVADSGGYAEAIDMGEQLGISEEHRLRVITSRLTWLKRWGAVEREGADQVEKRRVKGEPRPRARWRMTPMGFDLAMGQLRKSQEEALEKAKDGDMLLLTRLLAERQRTSGITVANLMRREYTYRTRFARNGR